ncbi:F-box only protein 43-like isoform X2 [Scylla paramamosain]
MQMGMTQAPQQEGEGAIKPQPLSSHNDSGYSSVLTSPESLCEGSKQQVVGLTEGLPSLTPEVTRRSTRLTSTPHTSSCQDVFRLPLPKIEGITRVGRTRYSSTSDSPVATTTVSTLEMNELEVTCEANISQKPLRVKTRLLETLQKPGRTKATVSSRLPPSRTITRLRKPPTVFIRLLKEADYLARRVLRYLSGEDLLRLSHVNQQLRDLIVKDKVLNSRRTSYLNARRSDHDRVGKENVKLKRLTEGTSSAYRTLSPRKQLSAIQNLSNTSAPKSPEKVITLAERFMQVGKNLTKGEELQKCVKCKSPAVVHKSQHRATCSRKVCGYDYCTNCHLTFHRRPHDCPVLRPRTRQASGIFSLKCKRNLRRL